MLELLYSRKETQRVALTVDFGLTISIARFYLISTVCSKRRTPLIKSSMPAN